MKAERLFREDNDPLKVRHPLKYTLGHRAARYSDSSHRQRPDQMIEQPG
jgi:hypothetical protein